MNKKTDTSLDPRNLSAARARLLEDGFVVLSQLFAPDFIEKLRQEYQRSFDDLINRRVPGRLLSIGPKRLHVTLHMKGWFLDPRFYANPFLDQFVRSLLGDDLIVSTLACATSFPGACLHRIHRDQELLYGNTLLGAELPPASLCLAINLVQTNDLCGATELVPGSHRDITIFKRFADGEPVSFVNPPLALGDAVVWDNRLVHRGLANNSHVPRPLLLMYHQRPWFRNSNIEGEAALQISPEDLASIDVKFRPRFAWRIPTTDAVTTEPVGRTSLCPCGSGVRFKSCCGALF